MEDVLISIRPEHVDNIKSGKKNVELRTRSLNLEKGDCLWVYTTLPVGAVEVSVQVEFIETSKPSGIWRKYKESICITKKVFDEYTKGRQLVTVVGFGTVRILDQPITLSELRVFDNKFTPPQFFTRLKSDKKVSAVFKSAE